MNLTKRCAACGLFKLRALFYADRSTANGTQGVCIACAAILGKARYLAHVAHSRAQSAAYYKAHRGLLVRRGGKVRAVARATSF